MPDNGGNFLSDLWNVFTGPGSSPTIREQIACPPGSHRRIGGGCEPDTPPPPPKVRELPDDEARGPLPDIPRPVPPGIPIPPKTIVPAPPPPPAPLPPADLPSPVDRTTGRYFPRGRAPLPTLGRALTRLGLPLWVLGTFVFTPYLARSPWERAMHPAPSGPPRRTRRGTLETLPAPRPWPDDPFPDYRPLPGFPRIPVPVRRPRVVTYPVELPMPTQRPTRLPRPGDRELPRTRAPVQPLPGELEPISILELPQPIDPLARPTDYDPFSQYVPTPSRPRVAPRATPRRVSPLDLPFPWLLPRSDPRSVPRSTPRRPVRPLTPQQPPPRSRPAPAPPPQLTPFNPTVPSSTPLPGQQFKPQRASRDPCTEQRTQRRRRQKECRRHTTKTIRVCAD